MWYVACTRARDLLIIPELPSASSQSWSKILDLGHDALPKLSLDHLPEPVSVKQSAVVNEQTAERFAREADAIARAAPPLTWVRPSDHDRDRAQALEPIVKTVDDAFEYLAPIGAGRIRGIVLHKLMEELLTGELSDSDATIVELRAAQLLKELLGQEDSLPGERPHPQEMARTAINTMNLADVEALRCHLLPEIAVWSQLPNGSLLAGRADALAVVDGNVIAAFDWKSDTAPSKGGMTWLYRAVKRLSRGDRSATRCVGLHEFGRSRVAPSRFLIQEPFGAEYSRVSELIPFP